MVPAIYLNHIHWVK